MPDIFDHHPKAEPTHTVHHRPEPQPEPNQTKMGPNDHALESVEKLMNAKDTNIGLLSAYKLHPSNVSFVNQEPDEVIILFLRHHFITNLPWLFNTFVLCLIPPLIFAVGALLPNLQFAIPPGLSVVLTIFYYLVVASYAFDRFIYWFYNIGIVTQKRIVDLDTTNILSHNTATATFGEIVEVKFIQRGFFQSFFDYGNIHIQTEAVHANFEFIASPKPTIVSDIISDLRVAQEGEKHGNT